MTADPSPGFFERLAARAFREPPVPGAPGPAPDAATTALPRVRRYAIGLAALMGALGVVLLYVPRQVWPTLFGLWTVTVSILGWPVEVPLFWTAYGLVLAVIEIVGLVLLNVRAVRTIARIYDFPPPGDPDGELHRRALIAIAVDRNAHSELSIGLNPWQGYSRARVTLIVVLARVKASLSNVVVKLLVRRLLGRYAVRLFIDLAGVPVMAAWNGYATKRLLDEAQARIFAPAVIRHCTEAVHRRYGDDGRFAGILYDLLQYGCVQKRAFQENHFLLATSLLRAFGVPIRAHHEVSDDFPAQLRTLDDGMRRAIVDLIVVGMILDGRLSWSERRAIGRLNDAGLLRAGPADVAGIATHFMQGRGVEAIRRELGLGA